MLDSFHFEYLKCAMSSPYMVVLKVVPKKLKKKGFGLKDLLPKLELKNLIQVVLDK